MRNLTLINNILTSLFFGGIICIISLLISPKVWLDFEAKAILSPTPTNAEQLFGNGTALAVKSFPFIVIFSIIASWILYAKAFYIIAILLSWLPLISFIIPIILFIYRILAN